MIFTKTEIGKKLHRFENLHARAWQLDSQDYVSDRKLREAHEAARAARQELIDAIVNLWETPALPENCKVDQCIQRELRGEIDELRALLRSLLAQVEETGIKHPQQAEHRDRARKLLEL